MERWDLSFGSWASKLLNQALDFGGPAPSFCGIPKFLIWAWILNSWPKVPQCSRAPSDPVSGAKRRPDRPPDRMWGAEGAPQRRELQTLTSSSQLKHEPLCTVKINQGRRQQPARLRNWSQDGPKSVPSQPKVGPKSTPSWSQSIPKWAPKLAPGQPEVVHQLLSRRPLGRRPPTLSNGGRQPARPAAVGHQMAAGRRRPSSGPVS